MVSIVIESEIETSTIIEVNIKIWIWIFTGKNLTYGKDLRKGIKPLNFHIFLEGYFEKTQCTSMAGRKREKMRSYSHRRSYYYNIIVIVVLFILYLNSQNGSNIFFKTTNNNARYDDAIGRYHTFLVLFIYILQEHGYRFGPFGPFFLLGHWSITLWNAPFRIQCFRHFFGKE